MGGLGVGQTKFNICNILILMVKIEGYNNGHTLKNSLVSRKSLLYNVII